MDSSSKEYPKARNTVDIVAIAYNEKGWAHVLLIKRGKEPFKDMWALPGGHIEPNEEPVVAAARELEEETGLKPKGGLSIIGTFLSDDPRGWTLTSVYAYVDVSGSLPYIKGADDAQEAKWVSTRELPEKLAFNHNNYVKGLSSMADLSIPSIRGTLLSPAFSGELSKPK